MSDGEDTYASPPDTASATASPDRLTLCHFLPPSVVCHRPGLNSQPSLEFANRTVDTAVAGDVVNGGTSWTFGAVAWPRSHRRWRSGTRPIDIFIGHVLLPVGRRSRTP